MPLGTAKLGGIVSSEHLHHLAQNAVPKAPLHDKCVGEETNVTAINTIGNPVDLDGCLLLHLLPPAMASGMRICSRRSLTRTLLSRTLPQQACSSQLHPRLVPAVPITSRMMLLGCLLGSGAHALAIATTEEGAAAIAWRFVGVASHMVQYLPPLLGAEHAPHSQLKLGEEEAMVCGCGVVVVCGCLFYMAAEMT